MGDEQNMNMYDRIDTLLKEKRINKRQLSLDLDIPYTTLVSMFKRKSTSVDIETIKKIANILDVDLDFLATGEIYPGATKRGTLIKQYRINSGISQKELSSLSQYSLDEIKKIEDNKLILNDDAFYELASFVCKDGISYLFADSDFDDTSKPLDKNYVVIWSNQQYYKFFLYSEQAEAVRTIASQFNDIYKKNEGIAD